MLYSFASFLSYRVEKANQVCDGFTSAGLLTFDCSEMSIYLEVALHFIESRKNIISH